MPYVSRETFLILAPKRQAPGYALLLFPKQRQRLRLSHITLISLHNPNPIHSHSYRSVSHVSYIMRRYVAPTAAGVLPVSHPRPPCSLFVSTTCPICAFERGYIGHDTLKKFQKTLLCVLRDYNDFLQQGTKREAPNMKRLLTWLVTVDPYPTCLWERLPGILKILLLLLIAAWFAPAVALAVKMAMR